MVGLIQLGFCVLFCFFFIHLCVCCQDLRLRFYLGGVPLFSTLNHREFKQSGAGTELSLALVTQPCSLRSRGGLEEVFFPHFLSPLCSQPAGILYFPHHPAYHGISLGCRPGHALGVCFWMSPTLPLLGQKSPTVVEVKVAVSKVGKEERKGATQEKKVLGARDKEEKKGAKASGKEVCAAVICTPMGLGSAGGGDMGGGRSLQESHRREHQTSHRSC